MPLNAKESTMQIKATRAEIEAYARYLMNQNPEQVQIFYECPCDTVIKVNHHFNYFRPYEVIRLCNKCHGLEHKRINGLRKNNKAA